MHFKRDTMLRATTTITVGLFMALGLLGCGSSGPVAEIEKTVSAGGVLTFQGKPLENYRIIFHPTDKKRPASARTDAEGKFRLGTNKPGDGAPAGKHRVTVSYVGPEVDPTPGNEMQEIPPAKVVIPVKYGSLDSSDITSEIPAGGDTNLKIDLK